MDICWARIFCSHGGNYSPEGGSLWTRTRLPFCTRATLLLSEVLEASEVEGAFWKSKNIISGAERGLRCYSKSPRIYEPNYKLHLAIWLLVMNFFRLEDKIMSGHILHADLLDMYCQPLNSTDEGRRSPKAKYPIMTLFLFKRGQWALHGSGYWHVWCGHSHTWTHHKSNRRR